MKAVIQRVSNAILSVENELISKIDNGLCVYFCAESGDSDNNVKLLAKKIANIRIFSDEKGKMNLSLLDKQYEVLLISQFTLCGDISHGNRPDFIKAEKSERANFLYNYLKKELEKYNIIVKMGVFGADMTINQINVGPVTIIASY